MTENHSYFNSDMKIMCRGCLQVEGAVYPMTAMEKTTYRNLVEKASVLEDNMNLCLVCKWLLDKCMRFSQQCQRANEMFNSAGHEDIKSNYYVSRICTYNITTSNTVTQYYGPEFSDHCNDGDEAMLDHAGDDDDDELPLVMLQDDYKNKRRKSDGYEPPPEIEIKLEPDVIKQELTEESSDKVRSKKKKVLREGFSSRMVQETDEYIVIKLTKEQVIAELQEKAKEQSYLRAPYKCHKCVKGFNFEDVLQTHMEKHSLEHGTYECEICSQYCPSPVSLRGHIKSHTTRYKCKLCGVVRLSRQHLLEHHAISHTARPTAYSCHKCHFTTNKRTVIQRHVKTHDNSERHACHRCGKLFNTIESLRVHTIRHDKSKRLQCPQCSKQFIYPSLLHKHIQCVHEREDYYCVECDVRFKSPESLRLHFKKAKRHRDSSSYKYECPQCPRRFVSVSSLSVHLSGGHGARRQHACAECRRRYSSRDALRAHTARLHKRAPHIATQ
ncbi:zinc finger protein 578 isoform X1 [Helicoverpa armigera]|uniref:zinc finger protein 578 isoform X1 n=1 Tax=Helicoverpa armigera TaxID=29058 RepID=UPI0030837BB7